MPQYIAYESDNKTVVENLCPGVTPEQLAEILHLPPGSWREITEEEAREMQKPTPEEEQAARLDQIDAETSAAILAGFDFEVDGQTLHFSYDGNDQQNFADTANVATLAQMGVPGLPETITWNGWRIEKDAEGKELSRLLTRVDLTMVEFLGLYTQGALAHKAMQMEIGSRRKAALYALEEQGEAAEEDGEAQDALPEVEDADHDETEAEGGEAES